jgi:hypothetical protein
MADDEGLKLENAAGRIVRGLRRVMVVAPNRVDRRVAASSAVRRVDEVLACAPRRPRSAVAGFVARLMTQDNSPGDVGWREAATAWSGLVRPARSPR